MAYKDYNKFKEYHARWKNSDIGKASLHKTRQKRKQRNKRFVKDYLLVHPCVDCGNTDIRVLEFDHIKGKKFACISILVRGLRNINIISKEIEKCEVRCKNCHFIRHLTKGFNNGH